MRRWWRYGPPEAKWLPGLVWRRHVAEFAVRLANQHKAGRKSGQQGSGQGDGELMSAAGRSNRDMTKQTSRVYQTISGRHIPMSKLNKVEKELLARVQQKYNPRLEWTRFAAWWNAEFNKTGLSTRSAVYRVCQDLWPDRGRTSCKNGARLPWTRVRSRCAR